MVRYLWRDRKMSIGKEKKDKKAPGLTIKKLNRDNPKPLPRPVRFPGQRVQVKHIY